MNENAVKHGTAERIAALRSLAEVSARSLSRAAGLAQGHVGLIENRGMGGARGLEAPTLKALARCLATTVDYLRDGTGEPPSADAVKRAARLAMSRRKRAEKAAKSSAAAPQMSTRAA